MPQRRRRIFIVGYLKGTLPYEASKKMSHYDWLLKRGLLARAFPVSPKTTVPHELSIDGDLSEVTNRFGKENGQFFENSGFMIGRKVTTMPTLPIHEGETTVIKDMLLKSGVPSEYFIKDKDLDKWAYLKGAKSYDRVSASGHTYRFSEGGMVFPDPLDRPCRTIITGEGGTGPSRFKHVITDPKTKKLRRLTPVELERANMFPDGHTDMEGAISDQRRAFFMGNALVVGVIERIGAEIYKASKSRIVSGVKAIRRKNVAAEI
jgi:DNA (cytosine-5)-methyltransferase 1